MSIKMSKKIEDELERIRANVFEINLRQQYLLDYVKGKHKATCKCDCEPKLPKIQDHLRY